MKDTKEQKEIIFSDEKKIFVSAVAGSGKTYTLARKAQENFQKHILVLMFNKDLRKNTKLKMPVNAEVHTANSLSYKHSRYKKRRIVDELSVLDIMEILDLKDSAVAFKTLEDYRAFMRDRSYQSQNQLVNILLRRMRNSQTVVDHDFILKEFVKECNLSCDILMIDEAQDLNPVMLDLIERIKHKQLVVVGDKRQAIYGFRNNISILEDSPYRLSRTFRFGPEIAEYVNDLTRRLYGESINMIGNEDIESKLVKESDIIGPYSAYISRTNSELFGAALDHVLSGMKISITHDWEDIKANVQDLVYLKLGMKEKIENRIYRLFSSLREIKTNSYMKELRPLIYLIEEYDIAILDIMKTIERNLVGERYSDIILTTAHKAKGLEYLNVKVAEDFNTNSEEEKNLIYVAATRAVKELSCNY